MQTARCQVNGLNVDATNELHQPGNYEVNDGIRDDSQELENIEKIINYFLCFNEMYCVKHQVNVFNSIVWIKYTTPFLLNRIIV